MEIDIADMLRTAYEDGRRDGMAEVMRWIPVSERLPEPRTTVAACGDKGIFYGRIEFYGDKFMYLMRDITRLVTHWMLLPEPPIKA